MSRKKKVNINNGNGYNRELTILREFKPKTKNQAEYVRSIVESDVVFCTGPAGCGKTACAVGIACEHLVNGKVSKIIITRPVVESGRQGLGYLPGDFKEKVHPYLIPILDEMNTYIGQYEVQNLIKNDIIEIAPLEYMRGRNFHHSFMLLDEAQNADMSQLKMFITRMGKESTCVVNGDLDQSDLGEKDFLGLKTCIDRLNNVDGVSIIKLTYEDIIRNHLINRILARLDG